MSIGIFSIVLTFRNPITNQKIKYLSELHHLGNTNPILAFSLTTILFSIETAAADTLWITIFKLFYLVLQFLFNHRVIIDEWF